MFVLSSDYFPKSDTVVRFSNVLRKKRGTLENGRRIGKDRPLEEGRDLQPCTGLEDTHSSAARPNVNQSLLESANE